MDTAGPPFKGGRGYPFLRITKGAEKMEDGSQTLGRKMGVFSTKYPFKTK
jgi:hypothetical protein